MDAARRRVLQRPDRDAGGVDDHVEAFALVGWAALGAGLAPLAPTVLGAAAIASARPAPQAIAAVTMVGYLGSFTGPPLIGALAGPAGLTGALGLMLAAALTAGLLAGPALPSARRSA